MGAKDRLGQERRIIAFLASRMDFRPQDLRYDVKQLSGGLVSRSVTKVQAWYRDDRGRCYITNFVVKETHGLHRRELEIYERLLKTEAAAFMPALLWSDRSTRDGGIIRLYLETISPLSGWPWKDASTAANVLRGLASLHQIGSDPDLKGLFSDWNYETELERESASLLQYAEQVRTQTEIAGLKATLPPLRRLVVQLPLIRRELMAFDPLGPMLIHGDVHAGTVMIRGNPAGMPVFLDWARARLGAPLEDVSSWLHSLRIWEPEVMRKHDSLLTIYLESRGLSASLSKQLREAHWLASACNSLAGALKHHLMICSDTKLDLTSKIQAGRALDDWLRVIRRADACLRG